MAQHPDEHANARAPEPPEVSAPALKVNEAIERALAQGPRHLVVATSGGPDSSALLVGLAQARKRYPLRLHAAGVDHGLRPEAPRELAGARALAESLGVPFTLLPLRVEEGGNLMARARDARYHALNTLRLSLGAEAIALGHTASDQAETLLMRLSRGTALQGAGGMLPWRGEKFRPLLEITREEVMAFLAAHGVTTADDPTNRNLRFARAQVRHRVLPVLREISSQATRHLAQFSARCQQDDALLQSLAREALVPRLGPLDCLVLEGLHRLPEPIQRRVWVQWLDHHGLEPSGDILERLQRASSGTTPLIVDRPTLQGAAPRRMTLSLGGHILRFEAGAVWLERDTPAYWAAPLTFPLGDETERVWKPLGCVITSRVSLRGDLSPPEDIEGRDASEKPDTNLDKNRSDLSKTPCQSRAESSKYDFGRVAFDADRLHVACEVRAWQPGDRFSPFGHPGHMKVGDLFTDFKVPRALRPHWPLLVHDDDILWVVGLRRGAAAPLTAESVRVLQFEVHGLECFMGDRRGKPGDAKASLGCNWS